MVVRGGMLPLGSTSGRASLMSTGQGLSAPKPPSRPSSLSSAIGRLSFPIIMKYLTTSHSS